MCMSLFPVFLLLLLLHQCRFHQLLTVNNRRRWRLLAGCLCCCRLCRCQSFVIVGREYITEHKAISVDGLSHFDVNRVGEDRAVPRERVELAILWAANTQQSESSSQTAAVGQQQSDKSRTDVCCQGQQTQWCQASKPAGPMLPLRFAVLAPALPNLLPVTDFKGLGLGLLKRCKLLKQLLSCSYAAEIQGSNSFASYLSTGVDISWQL